MAFIVELSEPKIKYLQNSEEKARAQNVMLKF